MKRIIITLSISILCSVAVFAQRSAYVDSDYILSNIPEYATAMQEIDDLSIAWQKEVESRFQEIDALYKKFQSDAPLLSDDMRKKRENEIITKEKEAKELQKKRFGVDGDLYKKRQEVIKPIQDKVYNAIEKRASDRGYIFVFDRSDNANILFADSKNDISNDILSDLGISVKDRKTIDVTPKVQQNNSTVDKSINVGN